MRVVGPSLDWLDFTEKRFDRDGWQDVFSDNRKKRVNGFGDAEIKPGKSVCSLTARTSGFTRNHPSTEGVGNLIAESVGPQSEVTVVGGLSDHVDHAGVEVVAEEVAVSLLAAGWVCA